MSTEYPADYWKPELQGEFEEVKPNGSSDAGNAEVVHAKDLQGEPPLQAWVIADLVPLRRVTILSGDSGSGKTRLAQQATVCASLGEQFLGRFEMMRTATLSIYTEDEMADVWRRLKHIAAHHGKEMADLEGVHFMPRLGKDSLLMKRSTAGTRRIEASDFCKRYFELAHKLGAQFLPIDPVASVYAGSDIDAREVREFVMEILTPGAMQINAAAFLLQHPSLSGLTGGSGNSGSRQWQATARSRLYLRPAEAAKDGEHEDGTFVLQTMKLNEGPDGGKVYLRNDNGIWSPAYEDEAADDWISKAQQDRELRARFLDAMLKFEQRGDRLHPHKNQTDYIVKKIAQKTRRNMRDLTRIYEQLLDDGCLVKTTLGSGTRAPQIVVLSEKSRAAAHV